MKTTKALFFELMYDFQSERWHESELPKLSLRELLALAKLLGCPSCGGCSTNDLQVGLQHRHPLLVQIFSSVSRHVTDMKSIHDIDSARFGYAKVHPIVREFTSRQPDIPIK